MSKRCTVRHHEVRILDVIDAWLAAMNLCYPIDSAITPQNREIKQSVDHGDNDFSSYPTPTAFKTSSHVYLLANRLQNVHGT